jgi:hypothetical protein
VKPLLVALIALVTLLAGAGCGGDGDSEQPSSKTTATQATDAGTTPPPAPPKKRRTDRAKKRPPQRTKTEPTKPSSKGNEKPSGRSRDTSGSKRLQVERYLRENFGTGAGAKPWYAHIEDVSVSGTTTTVETDIADNRRGREQAQEICLATNGTIPGVTDIVRVTGPGESILAKCVP